MKTTTKIAAAALAAMSLAAAGTVLAHPGAGPGMSPGMGMGMGMGMGPGMGHGMPAMHGGMGPGMRGAMHGPQTAATAATWLATMKDELKITPAQEATWQAYATVVQQQSAARETMRTEMQARMHAQPQDPKVDLAASREAMIKLHDAHFAARTAALKDLQAVLTPEQRLFADRRLAPGAGHRMAWRGH